MEKVRLNKFLRDCGIGSRRKVEDLIRTGQVAVHGIVITDFATQVIDGVTVNGHPVTPKTDHLYYKLNKPKGFLCSHKRHPGDRLIYDLFPEKTLFSVGRLDKETTGLLLLTTDGAFANRVIHPSSNITKEYVANTLEALTPSHLKRISDGTTIENTFVKPHEVTQIGKNLVKIVVKEGKKREVRILIQEAHLSLLTLHRTRIGKLTLGSLPEGEYAPLSHQEKALFYI